MAVDTIHDIVKDNFYRLGGNKPRIVRGEEIVDALSLPGNNDIIFIGALCFGIVMGWNLYFVNRWRDRKNIAISDLTTVIGALGGAVILLFFNNSTKLLAYYGIGLSVGFFVYFYILVKMSQQMGLYPRYFLRPEEPQNTVNIVPEPKK